MNTPSRELNELIDSLPAAQSPIEPGVASKWLMNVHFANGYDSDLNEAIEIMETFSPGAEINIQYLLTNFLINNDSSGHYTLQTLWHYLSAGDEKRLRSIKGQLEPQLKATDFQARINHKTDNPHHLAALIALLDGLGSSDIDYSKQLAKILYRKPDHPEALQGLAMIQRLKADEFNRVSGAYLCEHLAQGHELITQDSRKLALINTLHTSPNALMTYATTSLHKTMEGLPCEPALRNPERYLKNFKEKIDISIGWIKQSLNTETDREFLGQIDHMFFMIMQDDWRQEDNAPLIGQILDYLCEQLDQLQAPWRLSLERALCRRHKGVYDPVYAAGLSLLKSSKYLVMQRLSHKILGDLSTEELVEKFANKKAVLVEVYKHSGDAELIAHMDPQHKHASISHDLGM